MLGGAPAFSGAEQIEQAGRLLVGVAATQRLDAYLAPQRDGVHGLIAIGGDSDARRQNGCHRIGFG